MTIKTSQITCGIFFIILGVLIGILIDNKIILWIIATPMVVFGITFFIWRQTMDNNISSAIREELKKRLSDNYQKFLNLITQYGLETIIINFNMYDHDVNLSLSQYATTFDLPPRKWTQRRENGRIAIISKEVSDGAEEDKAV